MFSVVLWIESNSEINTVQIYFGKFWKFLENDYYCCMELKKQRKKTSGSVKIEPTVLETAREVCKTKGLILSSYITTAVFKENNRQKAK